MSANMIYLIVVILFMVMLAVIGIIISKGIETSEDWMVAGKSLGVIPMAGTYFATIVSAASIVSYMGYYYLNGWSGWWRTFSGCPAWTRGRRICSGRRWICTPLPGKR